MTDYIRGLDVSIIQGKVDFNAAFASGIKFVIVRCGVGNDAIDADYKIDIANAKAAGLKVMAYHFPFPLPYDAAHPTRSPIWQANTHFNAADGELAAIDVEWPAPQDWGKWGCSAAQINQWLLDYLAEYERLAGRKPVVYTYPYFTAAVKLDPKFGEYPLWIASYEATPTIPHPWTDWVMWQTSGGTAHLPNGVAVDADVAKDLSLWDAVDAPPPPPIVTPVIDVPAPPPPPPPPPVVVAPAPKPPLTHTPASTWITDVLDFFINLFSKK